MPITANEQHLLDRVYRLERELERARQWIQTQDDIIQRTARVLDRADRLPDEMMRTSLRDLRAVLGEAVSYPTTPPVFSTVELSVAERMRRAFRHPVSSPLTVLNVNVQGHSVPSSPAPVAPEPSEADDVGDEEEV